MTNRFVSLIASLLLFLASACQFVTIHQSVSPTPLDDGTAIAVAPTETPVPTQPFTPTQTLTPTLTVVPTSTLTPTPTATATLRPTVAVYETILTLSSYPFREFLEERVDPVYNIPVFYFRRAEFEAAAPTPTPVDYLGVVLENPHLRLTFLPELGGRLYSAVIKSTGQEIFYHNRVVKPSRYGILQPAEANWWLATGGLEWAYPVQEHGYRWGAVWNYEVSQTSDEATITLSDLGEDRVGVSVAVSLAAESALFTVKPQLHNAGSEPVPVQFWSNAALALAPHTMLPSTQFVVPVDEITVHSRGADGWPVPDARLPASWPRVGEIDLQDYSQWANYLGFFVPDLAAPFMGAYNPNNDLGVARLVAPGTVPGNKLFAFSLNFPYRDYTDDDSQYFEMWGGINRGFWPEDDVKVAPNEVVGWQERWWPLARLGGLTWANDQLAIHLISTDNDTTLAALVARPLSGTVTVQSGETMLLHEPFAAGPAQPLRWTFDTPNGLTAVTFSDSAGEALLTYLP